MMKRTCTHCNRPINEPAKTKQNSNFFQIDSRKFPGYQLDDKCRIKPKKDTPVVSFKWLKELLLSKDLDRADELNWANNGEYRFLDEKEDLTGNMVAFQSFPRCGNTFLRRLIEDVTGVYTGTDMNIDWCTPEAMMGLLGTYQVCDDKSVWVTKTHYPSGGNTEAHFNAQKLITIVRNPIDAIPSFANLVHLKSHSKTTVEDYHTDFPEWWTEWVES